MSGEVSVERVLARLDEHLEAGDPAAALRHLTYWLEEASATKNTRLELPLRNELMGLYRREGRGEEAVAAAREALTRLDATGLRATVAGGTTLLNAATVFSAFDRAEEAIPLFCEAEAIYERELPPGDGRLGGLYNNMGTVLSSLGRYREAKTAYRRALTVMEGIADSAPEQAVTYLNMADCLYAELGAVEAEEQVLTLLTTARALLDGHGTPNAHYAFVCEKCAPVFGFYGQFAYEATLRERAGRIYAGT